MRSTTHWPAGGVQSSDTVAPHLRRQVHHVALLHRVSGRHGRRPHVREAGQRHEGRLLLEPRHARSGVQHELGDLVLGRRRRKRDVDLPRGRRGRRHERHPEEAGLNRRERHRVLRRRAAWDVDDLPETLAVVARLEVGAGRRWAERPLEPRNRQRRPANRDWLSEIELDPRLLADRRHRERGELDEVRVGEQRRIDGSAAPRNDRVQVGHRHVAGRHPIGDDGCCRCRARAAPSEPDPPIGRADS